MTNVGKWYGPALAAVLLLAAPLIALETWARTRLFDKALYSNSDALDRTVRDFRERDDWRILLLGDSEVRWGFDPRPIELAFAREGITAPTMNFGLDGFSSGWGPRIAEEFHLLERAPKVRVVVYVVQLIETPEIVTHDNVCNASRGTGGGFQEVVFRSPLARDWGIADACSDGGVKTEAILLAQRALATVRYREAIRSRLLGAIDQSQVMGMADVALPYSFNGFQPHVPRVRNGSYQIDLDRVLAVVEKGDPAYRTPPPTEWDGVLSPTGFFAVTAKWFTDRNVVLVLTPAPTNPMLIDLKQRRSTYELHRKRLRAFAQAHPGAVYVDMPIRDDLDKDTDYTDHRHLSGAGAARYSADLAAAMAADTQIRAALEK